MGFAMKKPVLYVLIVFLLIMTEMRVGTATPTTDRLMILGPSGIFEEVLSSFVIRQFEKDNNVKVVYKSGSYPEILSLIEKQKGFDIIFLNDRYATIGREKQLFGKLTELSSLNDIYDFARGKEDLWVGIGSIATGIIYNKDEIKETDAPKSWKDLYDPKFKGKVAIPFISAVSGVHSALGTAKAAQEEGVAAKLAFEMIKESRDHFKAVSIDAADLYYLFRNKEIYLCPLPSTMALSLIEIGMPVGFVYPREGSFVLNNTASIVINTPNPQLAKKFIEQLINEHNQHAFLKVLKWIPTNKKVALPKEREGIFPTPSNIKLLESVDWTYFIKNEKSLAEKWREIIPAKKK